MIQSLRDFGCIQQCAHYSAGQKRRHTKGFLRSLARMATLFHCAVFLIWPRSLVVRDAFVTAHKQHRDYKLQPRK